MTATSADALTPREREILTMIAQGDSLAEIAQKLSRSLKTIESHRLAIGKKLGASNRVELTHIAIAAGLIKIKTDRQTNVQNGDTSGLAETELAWLHQINDACANKSGATFIKQLCDAMSMLPGIKIAAICTPDPTLASGRENFHRYVIAMSNRGEALDPVRYHAVGTPCEAILRDGQSCFSQGVAQAFPNDAWLEDIKAESYVGIELQREDGSSCGAFALVGCEPLEQVESLRNLMSFFAQRLTAELHICLELDALRSRCEQLEAQSEALAKHATADSTVSKEAIPPPVVAMTQLDIDVQSLTGAEFLRIFANSLCKRLGLKIAGICMCVERSDKTVFTTVMYSVGGEIEENFTYSPENMPCHLAVKNGIFSLPKDVPAAYPDVQFFTDMGIEAYIGVKLINAMGQCIGNIWVADTEQINDASTVEQVLQHYAPRVGTELDAFIRVERMLLEQEDLKRELRKRIAATH